MCLVCGKFQELVSLSLFFLNLDTNSKFPPKNPTQQQPNKNLQSPPPIFTLNKNLNSIYSLYLNKDFYKYPKVFLVTHYFKNVKIGISKPFFSIQCLTKIFQCICWMMFCFFNRRFLCISVFDGTSTAGSGDSSVWGLPAACVTQLVGIPDLQEGRPGSCVLSEMVSLLLHNSMDTPGCKAM